MASVFGLASLPLAAAESVAPSTPTPAPPSGEDYATVADDGAWCWFSDPRAIAKDGQSYTGWVTADGSIQVGQIDNASHTIKRTTIHKRLGRDDHNNPAFLFLPDNRLAAFYCTHAQDDLFLRITEKPGDISSWTPIRRLGLLSQGFSKLTYVNPVMLANESNTIYLFFRGADWMPTLSISTDLAQSWSKPQTVIRSPQSTIGNRPYAKYWDDGKGRIDILFTDGHPRESKNNHVHFMRYEKNAFWKADGTRIAGMAELPIDPEKTDLVYDASAGRGWIWDLGEDEQGAPCIAYTRLPGDTAETLGRDHRYHYAAWDGKRWNDHEIARGGKWFQQTPKDQKEPEPHYSGGIAIDKRNPAIVYYSAPVGNRFEIFKATTPDRGATWERVAVTQKSYNDNVRPIAIRSYEPGSAPFYWLNLRYYPIYTVFDASIRMPVPAQPQAFSAELNPPAIISAMKAAADWQLEHPLKHSRTDWATAPFYVGLMALAPLASEPKYADAAMRMGVINCWQPGPLFYHADDHCISQPYLEFYLKTHDRSMLAPTQKRFDEILAKIAAGDKSQIRWSWSDALFMAPPTWIRLYAATGDRKYLDFLNQEWRFTCDLLYDQAECLYFRDASYIKKREANGKKLFWSRGNGWAFAGLARVLQYYPKAQPVRSVYEKQFKDMAAKILSLQQPDGLWHPSLLDPQNYPVKESSGSAFYCFGLAWGINAGYLDRATYAPAVEKAWSALVGCLEPNGRLAYVQPAAAEPQQFDPKSTLIYAPGAFLLAGAEMVKLLNARIP
jgi:rhamnogalacturonyl hydrolase YesR